MKNVKNIYKVQVNKIKLKDEGDGFVRFSKPLPITDNSEQYNGTRYDIKSMDISGYRGLLTVDHSESVEKIVGKVSGLEKKGNKIVIDGIQFATEKSALARFTKDMMLGGFITDFSIESFGPWPDDEGVYYDSELVGLSAVITGNNKKATVNQLATKVINSAKADGLDTSFMEENYVSLDKNGAKVDNDDMKYIRSFPVTVSFKNAAGDEVEKELAPEETVDVAEDQAEDVEAKIEDAEKPVEKKEVETPESKEDKEAKEAIDEKVNNLLAPVMDKLEKVEQRMFDNSAAEPKFTKEKTAGLRKMGYLERHGDQINNAWDFLKKGSEEAGAKLNKINEIHLELLKDEGLVENQMTISDFGNFVISPELLKDIEGHRSNFTPLLNAVEFKETLSLQMAYLVRSGDISMSEVENCDDGLDGNLKPISEYTAASTTKNLVELAAVTPVCNAATRFLAVDLLADVAAGYRNDYDRKRAQLVIARLQQAVDSTGNVVTYDTTSDVQAVVSWIDAWVDAQEEIMNGTFIFSQKTYGELLKRAIAAGISGPLSGLFTTGDQPLIAGSPYIVVPNELLPTLNTAETKSFTVDGATVTITHAVFYADLSTFTGRTSGGLNYDLSTEASYEIDGTVYSAYQRNELVLRGSFFRNGAVRDVQKVAAMGAPGVS
jgi:hypothetical protein